MVWELKKSLMVALMNEKGSVGATLEHSIKFGTL